MRFLGISNDSICSSPSFQFSLYFIPFFPPRLTVPFKTVPLYSVQLYTINDYDNYWSLHAAKSASHLRTSKYKITQRSMCERTRRNYRVSSSRLRVTYFHTFFFIFSFFSYFFAPIVRRNIDEMGIDVSFPFVSLSRGVLV